jgi:hypothetical protein
MASEDDEYYGAVATLIVALLVAVAFYAVVRSFLDPRTAFGWSIAIFLVAGDFVDRHSNQKGKHD